MATSLTFYQDAGLTTPLSSKSINHLVDGSGDPQTFTFYLGSTVSANKFQNNANPGVAALSAAIVNATPAWSASTSKSPADKVRTTAKNGYRYLNTNTGSGITGAAEPIWPTTVGATVADNTITWQNDGKIHESNEIRLALSEAGLVSATPGAALALPVTILGGVANAIPVWMRIDDATAVIASATELSLLVANVLESPQ